MYCAHHPEPHGAQSVTYPTSVSLHVAEAQRKLLQLSAAHHVQQLKTCCRIETAFPGLRRFDEAQEQLVEALMALPFAEECLLPSAMGVSGCQGGVRESRCSFSESRQWNCGSREGFGL